MIRPLRRHPKLSPPKMKRAPLGGGAHSIVEPKADQVTLTVTPCSIATHSEPLV